MTYVFGVSVIGMIIMVLISSFVYKMWIGEKAVIPYVMTLAVALYMIVYSWDTLQVNLINGIGKIQLQSYVTLIGLICHIPLSLLLGEYLGALGVVLSMILINCIYSVFFTIQLNKILCCKDSGVWTR